ncbi:MAG: hypothetical protein LAO31_18395 [Acidobacteriia bacterium]|nr:hypothetical protein [Terriglobia bacterium]
MNDQNGGHFPWRLFASELVGTALLVLVGLSLVILMFGAGSPIARVLPHEGLRRLVTGFLFGTTGALIALSPVGTGSGRWPECFWPSSPAVSLRSASKSPNCTTATATVTACFAAWPGPS